MVSVASSGRGIAKAIGIGTIGHTGICSGSSVTKTVRIRSRTVSIASSGRGVAKAVSASVVGDSTICTGGSIAETIGV